MVTQILITSSARYDHSLILFTKANFILGEATGLCLHSKFRPPSFWIFTQGFLASHLFPGSGVLVSSTGSRFSDCFASGSGVHRIQKTWQKITIKSTKGEKASTGQEDGTVGKYNNLGWLGSGSPPKEFVQRGVGGVVCAFFLSSTCGRLPHGEIGLYTFCLALLVEGELTDPADNLSRGY